MISDWAPDNSVSGSTWRLRKVDMATQRRHRMATLCSHVNCQFEVFLPRSQALAWERNSWKLCFPIVRTASDAFQPTIKVNVSCMIARQFAKRSFEAVRSQAGTWERGDGRVSGSRAVRSSHRLREYHSSEPRAHPLSRNRALTHLLRSRPTVEATMAGPARSGFRTHG